MSDDEALLLADLAAMVMTQIEVQNTIGRIHPSSGLANEYQFFEDVEDLVGHRPGEHRVGLLIELASQQQITHGSRVVGSAYAES